MSRSSPADLAALIPSAYFLQTRVKGAKDLIYLVVTSFVPAWWMLIRLVGIDPYQAAVIFAAGYLAFIAVYELGYLANDLVDARRTRGRQRWKGAAGPPFVASFVAIRLATWAAVGWATGWIGNPTWLLATGALAIVFTLHNLIRAAALRSATFVQLALLRFTVPMMGVLDGATLPPVMLLALLLYVYLRWLAYLDSKELLNIAERREPLFAVTQMALFLPLLALIAFVMRTSLPLELWVLLLGLYVSRQMVDRRQHQN